MSELSKKILETINQEGLKPKPRWQFLMRQYVIWLAAVFSAIIGSVAFSVIIFALVNDDWEILNELGRTPLQHTLNTLPYIWIIIMGLFILLAYYNGRHTKSSYRYRAYWFVGGSMIVSIVFGGVFYVIGLGPGVHYFIRDNLPFYQVLMHERGEVWVHPENGLLGGQITSMLSGVGMFELQDFYGEKWVVRPGLHYMPPPPPLIIEVGEQVRIVGDMEQGSKNIFDAEKIYPFYIGPGRVQFQLLIENTNSSSGNTDD
ncbi:MAG: hypothetical protein WCV50_01050 [Patescibacteria group bacterium]|jgi:hypothetical protein